MPMKLLWGSSIDNPVSYSGEHYRLEDAHLSLLPVQKPHPPIYIGAFTSTKLFNLIGEMCQGWLSGNPNTEASFKRKVSVMSKAAQRSNRSIDEIDVIAQIPFAVRMIAHFLEEEESRQDLFNRIPLGHAGQPEDVAYGALYLASDESSFVTGSD